MRIRLFLVFTLALGAFAGAQAEVQRVNKKRSAEFEQLKSLVGLWEGVMPAKEGKGDVAEESSETMKMRVEYRLTAGGSVIQETFNAGTPMEMITMYHDTRRGLRLTHYCMLGNQPRMVYTGARDDGALQFTLSKDSELDQDKDAFMHSLVLTIVDDKNIVQGWTMYQDGEAQSQDIHLTRVK